MHFVLLANNRHNVLDRARLFNQFVEQQQKKVVIGNISFRDNQVLKTSLYIPLVFLGAYRSLIDRMLYMFYLLAIFLHSE